MLLLGLLAAQEGGTYVAIASEDLADFTVVIETLQGLPTHCIATADASTRFLASY